MGSMPEVRPPFPLETFSQSAPCPRERREIEELSLELPDAPLSSLVTLMMLRRLELDFHQEPERLSHPPAELWLESSLAVKELISHSLRLMPHGTRPRQRE